MSKRCQSGTHERLAHDARTVWSVSVQVVVCRVNIQQTGGRVHNFTYPALDLVFKYCKLQILNLTCPNRLRVPGAGGRRTVVADWDG